MESLFTRLDREWDRFVADPAVAGELSEVCALAGVSSLADLVPAVRAARPEEADPVLAALARRAAGGSAVAARTLLQLLLPGTCRLAARWWALGDAEERAAAAVTAVYDRICRYPFDRRPRRIAANVLLDAGQDLWRAARRAGRHAEHHLTVDPQAMPAGDEREPTSAEELTALVTDAVEAGFVGADDAALILATRVGCDDLPAIARRRGTPLRTLQWRRRAAEERLVACAGAVA